MFINLYSASCIIFFTPILQYGVHRKVQNVWLDFWLLFVVAGFFLIRTEARGLEALSETMLSHSGKCGICDVKATSGGKCRLCAPLSDSCEYSTRPEDVFCRYVLYVSGHATFGVTSINHS